VSIDFIANDCQAAIEVKGKKHVGNEDLRALRELKVEQPQTGHRIVVSMETRSRLTDDGILILPYIDFIQGLWSKEWF